MRSDKPRKKYMMITAKEAHQMMQNTGNQAAGVGQLTALCRAIHESSARGLSYAITDMPLTEADYRWLETNGYEVWTRLEYMKKSYLVSWANAM